MAIFLDVKAGPFAGRQIEVPAGQPFLIGRAPDRSNFAIPQDTYMSGVHFAVEHGPQGCRISDRKSSNGTYLNGSKITEAPLTNGDEIRTGQTVFAVRIVSDARPAAAQPLPRPPAPAPPPPAAASPNPAPVPPQKTAGLPPAQPPQPISKPFSPEPVAPMPSARPEPPAPRSAPAPQRTPSAPSRPSILTIGSWSFSLLPPGWQIKEEFGMERAEKGCFPSSVIATEEILGAGVPLQQFVESQVSTLRQYLREPNIEAAVPPHIEGADEKALLNIHYKTKDGQALMYCRLYARSGRSIGTITLTSLESDLPQTRPAFDTILSGLSFAPKTS